MATRRPATTEQRSPDGGRPRPLRDVRVHGLPASLAAALVGAACNGAALSGCGGAAPASVVSGAEESERERVAVALRLEDAGVRAGTDVPETRIALAVIREADGRTETHRADLASGVCSSASPPPGVLAAVRCWWAGAGANYALVRSGDTLVVRRARVEEESPEDAPAEVVLRVPLSAAARVEVIGAEPPR